VGEHRCPGGSLQFKEIANMVSVMMGDNYVGYIRRRVTQPVELADYAPSPTLVTGID
jgi:hypothetical protein